MIQQIRNSTMTLVCIAAAACAAPDTARLSAGDGPGDLAVPNDNRVPAGRRTAGGVELHLEARLAGWRPDLDVDSAVTVQAFAEPGGAAHIPGPLLRAEQGTSIRVTIRNAVRDSTLVVHGFGSDTLRIPPGATGVTEYVAGEPGTYLYWGTTSGSGGIAERAGRDSQLTGAIVIDAAGTVPDPDERIFVMTVLDILPDTVDPAGSQDDLFELAVNGLSWPHSERLRYDVGDTVRWRWLNGSYLPHPMHLHGFHFRVLSKGDGGRDVPYPGDATRDVVTEMMSAGTTFRMDWVPTREGNWLFHCHMTPHITPFPERPDSVRALDAHDPARHATTAMSGLVLGISTTAPRGRSAAPDVDATRPADHVVAARRLRLFVRQGPADSAGRRAHGYVIERDAPPRADSIVSPGPPLVLTRGETVSIAVVNRTDDMTTVHWHGMELESLYDGVAGWSGNDSNVAPMIAPGDSFVVSFTPPRAGTFIYHTHMDETEQLRTGAYGPLLVLEPEATFDPATDLVFMIGGAIDHGIVAATLNGRSEPPPRTLLAGTTYRLRFVNIQTADVVGIELLGDSVPVTWTPIAKDGAALPVRLRRPAAAAFRSGVGETFDFEWTPALRTDVHLVIGLGENRWIRQTFRIR